MNLSTLIGALVGFAVLATAIFLQTQDSHLAISIFWNLNSLLIVLGAVIAATFISYPFRDVLNVMKVFRLAIIRDELPVAAYIEEIEALSGEAKRGTSILQGAVNEVGNYFLELGLQMVVEKYSPEEIREIMTDQANYTYRHQMGEAKIFRTMAKLSPAFGVVGTLIGLVIMMKGLNPEDAQAMMNSLGSGMATALLTTFYGVLLSNLVFFPIAVKVEKRIEEQRVLMTMIMEGTLLIQKRSPRDEVQKRLDAFLPPQKWASIRQRK